MINDNKYNSIQYELLISMFHGISYVLNTEHLL